MDKKSFLKIATTDPFAMVCGVLGAVVGGIIGLIFGGPLGGVLGGVFGFTFLLGGAGVRYVQHKRDLKAHKELLSEVRSRCDPENRAQLLPLLEAVHQSGLSAKVKKDVYDAARAQLTALAFENAEGAIEVLKRVNEMEATPSKPKGGLIASLTGRHSARGLIPGILKSVREGAAGVEQIPTGSQEPDRQRDPSCGAQVQGPAQGSWQRVMQSSPPPSGPGRPTTHQRGSLSAHIPG